MSCKNMGIILHYKSLALVQKMSMIQLLKAAYRLLEMYKQPSIGHQNI